MSMVDILELGLCAYEQRLIRLIRAVDSACTSSDPLVIASLEQDLEFASDVFLDAGCELITVRERAGKAYAKEALTSKYGDLLWW